MSQDSEIQGLQAELKSLKDELAASRALLRQKTVSQEKYAALVENSLAGFYIIQEGVFKYASPRLVEMLGCHGPEDLLDTPFWKVAHPQDRELVKARGAAREQGQIEPASYTFRAMKKDGTQIWLEIGGNNSSYQGKPANIGNFVDITGLKRAEEALRQSEEKYRTILEAIEDGYYEVDLAGDLTFFNEAFLRIWGYPRLQLMGMNYQHYTGGDEAENVYRVFNRVFTTGQPTRAYSWQIARPDGQPRQVELSVSLVRDESGKGVGFRGIARDVTRRKDVELELKRHRLHLEEMVTARTSELLAANERLEKEITERRQMEKRLLREKHFNNSVIDALPGMFYLFDQKGRFVQWNRSLETTGGYTGDEVSGMNALDFYEGDDQRRVAETIKEVFEHGKSWVEARVLSRGGRRTPHLLTGVRVELDGQVYLVGIGVDITKRAEAEEALRSSERELKVLSSQLLEAQEMERGRVARELHDGIGQTLTAIKFGLEKVFDSQARSQAPGTRSELQALVPMIQSAVEEVRRISMALRPSTLDDLGILATIKWFCREFSRIYGDINIERQIDIAEEHIPEALKTVIYRLLQEALNNVAKHSGAKKVVLSLSYRHGMVELRVQDFGAGFDLERVLASDSAQRGFGLASLRERTELSGGVFYMHSCPGQGTSIKGVWPVART